MVKTKKSDRSLIHQNINTEETYTVMKKPTRKEKKQSKIFINKVADLIDSFIVLKKRYLTIELLRKILVLESICHDEIISEELYNEKGDEYLKDIESATLTDYSPEYLDDLLDKLRGRKKLPVTVNVTPKWIKKVSNTHAKLYEDPKHWQDC